MFRLFKKKVTEDSYYTQIHRDLTARQEEEMARTVVRELDRIYDRVSALPLFRREAVRCLVAAAGRLLETELSSTATEYRHVDAASRDLINIALNELGLELKD